jgi:hypothetical protein
VCCGLRWYGGCCFDVFSGDCFFFFGVGSRRSCGSGFGQSVLLGLVFVSGVRPGVVWSPMLSRVNFGLSCVLAEFSRWLVGGLVRALGVLGCRIRRHHQNGEGGASRTGSEPQKGGDCIVLLRKKEKGKETMYSC